ncbi:glutamine--tRNA ligase/YqeY domain fusion protein [Geomonas subterranea]|uniref:Glutamine--tRNA ligase n=1 Tax=Geomonas subterranea TaxID=2847989 RepID=A0ABX8LF09_9BACT|nr:glutamine--tRNA ligase/YqeY domain fusion protein [Geomonas subterranea]QXE90298.1 glutamine--tRNA ligase/YqeY domain fusion protein [Geomonas subterranea]QXM07576.1 glutamine--tRNA ligase/YqeY domain fusion protein [Geomonas subterranea]
MTTEETPVVEKAANFIRNIVTDDLKNGKHQSIVTRFPPEPNGYLHIGHAKSICLNFGLARDFGGRCHLRFDDTNPTKEDIEYEDSIKENVKWLGFDWGQHMYYASDYFEKFYQYAQILIEKGLAYVDSSSADEIRAMRGTLSEPGKESPYRNREVAENLDLFARMRAGEFEDGTQVLRLKIDMASPNINLRDPVIYRIKKVDHHRTGDAWCIYPMYDYAHCISDAIEGITHSICTLEFEDHRPLYDWVLDQLPVPCHPRQIEFARLNLNYTVMSKRKLLELVQEKLVDGWDDPRMPTLVGIRRRGFTPESIRAFCETIGVGKSDSLIDMSILEDAVREDLNLRAPRAMAVLRPLKVVIEGYPEGETEEFEAANHPNNPEMGSRMVPFGKTVYIERDDFQEEPAKGFFRMAPGKEVRLRYAYIVKCESVVKDENGEVVEVHCSYDPGSRGGSAPDGRKIKGTIHWVSAEHAVNAEVRLYDRLFSTPNPGGKNEPDYRTSLNPNSIEVLNGCKLEPSLAAATQEDRFQFERLGYFCPDLKDSRPGALVFNRTATLRDSWNDGKR